MNHALASITLAAVLSCAACASPPGGVERSDVLPLGDHYECAFGSLFVIHVQDEYRLIRCVSGTSGTISGCYDDVLAVPTDDVRWNRWIDVPNARGLELAIVSPAEVAFRIRPGVRPDARPDEGSPR